MWVQVNNKQITRVQSLRHFMSSLFYSYSIHFRPQERMEEGARHDSQATLHDVRSRNGQTRQQKSCGCRGIQRVRRFMFEFKSYL